MNQLATVKANATESALMSWDDKVKMASTLIKSGFLPPAYKTPEQVIAVMMKGQELGIPTMEALTSINVIQQKPTLSPQLMLALVRRTGQLQDLQIEKLPDSVKVTVTRKGQSPVASSFGKEEADALGLSGKDNYKKQRFVMYQWRALAANLRLTFSDCIAGMYTPEEMGAEVKVADDGGQLLVESHVDNMDEPGNNSTAFNPTETHIEKGKYSGSLWIEVPVDYLEWAAKQSGELAQNAKATLAYMDANRAPEQPPISAELFPTYDELERSFQLCVNFGNFADLERWGKDNKTAIEKLGPEVAELFRKSYRDAAKDMKVKK